MRIPPAIALSELDKEWLLRQSRSSIAPKRLGERCRIVLLAAEGKTNEQIGKELGITDKEAGRWRTRFVQMGRIGIEKDEPGRGRKLTYPAELRELIVEKTTRSTPPDAAQWSRASMTKANGYQPEYGWGGSGSSRI